MTAPRRREKPVASYASPFIRLAAFVRAELNAFSPRMTDASVHFASQDEIYPSPHKTPECKEVFIPDLKELSVSASYSIIRRRMSGINKVSVSVVRKSK